MRALYTSILLYMCLVFAGTTFAQSSCDLHIVVNVRDSRGGFVSDLETSSFHAKLGGREAAVTAATTFAGSNRMILVLDASGSMRPTADFWTSEKELSKQIVTSAPPNSKLALLVFNRKTIRKVDFGHSRQELLTAIEELPDADGSTVLWDSLLEAGETFGSPISGDALLVITDGADGKSKATPDNVHKLFLTKGIRIFAIGLRTWPLLTPQWKPQFTTEEELMGPQLLANLAQATGGNTTANIASLRKDLRAANPDASSSVVNQLMDEISHFYVLQIPLSMKSSKKLEIALLAGDGRKNKGVSLHYPQKSPPCTE